MATENYFLKIQGTCQGQYRENVMVFQGTGLTTTDTIGAGLDLISAWKTHIQALWLATLPASYFLDCLVARRVMPKPSATPIAQNQAFIVSGTRGSQATSYNLCPAVFLVPPMGTKSGGKVFMPCVGQGDIVNNSYVTGYTTAVNALFAAMLTTFAGSGTTWQLAIYSRKNGTVVKADAAGLSERLGYIGKRRRPVGSA